MASADNRHSVAVEMRPRASAASPLLARDPTRVAHVGKTRRVLGGSEKQFLLCAEFPGLVVCHKGVGDAAKGSLDTLSKHLERAGWRITKDGLIPILVWGPKNSVLLHPGD
jgi:hypothetical protein